MTSRSPKTGPAKQKPTVGARFGYRRRSGYPHAEQAGRVLLLALLCVAALVLWQRPMTYPIAQPLATGYQVRLNHAAAGELTLLPGIGPTLAEAIVADRQAHGAYQDVAELQRVKRVGAKTVERVRPWVRLD